MPTKGTEYRDGEGVSRRAINFALDDGPAGCLDNGVDRPQSGGSGKYHLLPS